MAKKKTPPTTPPVSAPLTQEPPMLMRIVDISSLRPDPQNARKHDKKNIDAIKDSLTKYGQQKPIVVDLDGVVIAGNGTLAAAKELNWTRITIVETQLTGKAAKAFAIADNRTAELAAWDPEALADILKSMSEMERLGTGFTAEDFNELVASVDPELSGKYSVKIVSPIYEQTGERPEVSDLFDREKTETLITEINAAVLPDPVASFLRFAAERHTVFQYAKIAEWYAHASPEEKALAERSGLVIIDFESAIENGFVELTERIRGLSEEEEAAKDAES